MMMQTQEAMASKDVVKGKRTKRQRPPSPPTLTMVSSSSSGGAGGGCRGGSGAISDNSGGILDHSTTSATTSAEFTDSTEEEEDMANCLILLAQGRHSRKLSEPIAAAASAAATKVGLYVYQCKTCNRCFPSFQALGGHRASHKKLKANIEDQKKIMYLIEEGDDRFSNTSTTLSLQIPNRAKFHECSICGAEFTSGQALGGHMRRHRSTFTSSAAAAAAASTAMSLGTSRRPESTQAAMVKQRNVVELDLDLNLPAPPEDGHRESKFSFKSKEQVIVFSASSLVDCHY